MPAAQDVHEQEEDVTFSDDGDVEDGEAYDGDDVMGLDGDDGDFDVDADEFEGGEDDYSQTSDDAADDEYDAFTSNINKPVEKEEWEITYETKSTEQIRSEQHKLIDQVVETASCDPSTAGALLRHYKWKVERLTEAYFEDPASVLAKAGLDPRKSPIVSTASAQMLPAFPSASSLLPSAVASSSTLGSKNARPGTSRTRSKPRKTAPPKEPFECPICCLDYASDEVDEQTISLGCEHTFCKACWREYMERKVLDEQESGKVQCMESGCGKVVGETVVQDLLSGKALDRYQELLDRTYVDDNPELRWCPHPGCEYAVKTSEASPRKLDQIIPIVKCNCGGNSCFGCGLPADHRPLTCKYVKMWEKKCADDSETSNWLMANTKECSKCASTIEKNGGCNHMTCKKCRYEFCWVCMADWTSHGTSYYNCNRFDEKAGVQARDAQATSRASLERYLHYFNRWANHEQSAKLDKELYANTEITMEKLQTSTALTWIEVQFVRKAADVLLEARMTLKWTYAMAFYLKKCNSTSLFEDNQANLESAVEALSELLENLAKVAAVEHINEVRASITNQTAYVQKRSDIIMKDTLRGHYDSRWEFSQ